MANLLIAFQLAPAATSTTAGRKVQSTKRLSSKEFGPAGEGRAWVAQPRRFLSRNSARARCPTARWRQQGIYFLMNAGRFCKACERASGHSERHVAVICALAGTQSGFVYRTLQAGGPFLEKIEGIVERCDFLNQVLAGSDIQRNVKIPIVHGYLHGERQVSVGRGCGAMKKCECRFRSSRARDKSLGLGSAIWQGRPASSKINGLKRKNRACSARSCHYNAWALRVRYAAKVTAPVRET
jgi:hypothetical protein